MQIIDSSRSNNKFDYSSGVCLSTLHVLTTRKSGILFFNTIGIVFMYEKGIFILAVMALR